MMGGERECNEMILGQRDMIKLEKEYYRDEVVKLALTLLVVIPIVVISLSIYFKFK
jgi:hypothetical protein